MSTTKHTPGPWSARTQRVMRAATITAGDARTPVAVTTGSASKAEHEANACLIAASPEMLAALQAVADYWAGGDVPAELDAQMRAAIAKATGAA